MCPRVSESVLGVIENLENIELMYPTSKVAICRREFFYLIFFPILR